MELAPRPRVHPADERAREHAALASPVRQRLLDLLVAAPGPRALETLASEMGLHPSTVRGHLHILEDVGLVTPLLEPRGLPGRPRVLFEPTAKARACTVGCTGYRMLARILTAYLSCAAEDPGAAAERAGRAWAAHVTGQEPRGRPRVAETVARARELLEVAGFETEVGNDGEGTFLRHRGCPFGLLVDEHPDVVCSLHLGLAAGLVDGLGEHLEVSELSGSVEDRACTVRLRRRSQQL